MTQAFSAHDRRRHPGARSQLIAAETGPTAPTAPAASSLTRQAALATSDNSKKRYAIDDRQPSW
jgi:hypothetical protein